MPRRRRFGRLREVFACGTAVVVTAIGFVRAPDGDFTVANGGEGRFTADLREQLVDIQRARSNDPQGSVHPIL